MSDREKNFETIYQAFRQMFFFNRLQFQSVMMENGVKVDIHSDPIDKTVMAILYGATSKDVFLEIDFGRCTTLRDLSDFAESILEEV
ncbi:hypothetical protein CMK18_23960 [Candidatus Poribacteria bacterium]|nr:hypothetical protein [Candidatus Poribacteria bacterium]